MLGLVGEVLAGPERMLVSETARDPARDPARGRAIVADRTRGLCLLCHQAPIAEERFQGNLGPDLAGIGARLSVEELRARVSDARAANPASIMPSYFRIEGLHRVAPQFQGRSILTAQEIEDVVAWLSTLR
jgi:sulfur-oxidizing protein SoxX